MYFLGTAPGTAPSFKNREQLKLFSTKCWRAFDKFDEKLIQTIVHVKLKIVLNMTNLKRFDEIDYQKMISFSEELANI